MKNAAKHRNRPYNLAALEATYKEQFGYVDDDDDGKVHEGLLTDVEKVRFDTLMSELIKYMKLVPGRNDDHINELRWQNLPKFLADKKIKTFIEGLGITKLVTNIRHKLSSIFCRKKP